MGDIISDDVIFKNGSDRKSGLITEISSIPAALLTPYYLEQATVSVQPVLAPTNHTSDMFLSQKKDLDSNMNLSWGLQCWWEATSNTAFMAVLQKPSRKHPVQRVQEQGQYNPFGPIQIFQSPGTRSPSPAVLSISVRERSTISFEVLFHHLALPSQARQGHDEPCYASAVSLTSRPCTSKCTR